MIGPTTLRWTAEFEIIGRVKKTVFLGNSHTDTTFEVAGHSVDVSHGETIRMVSWSINVRTSDSNMHCILVHSTFEDAGGQTDSGAQGTKRKATESVAPTPSDQARPSKRQKFTAHANSLLQEALTSADMDAELTQEEKEELKWEKKHTEMVDRHTGA
ncbi:hypothetical protein NX059_004045 [Plenodomus lindquistii]|nr:hypothetical protein NX059_004045 [Plenodomus lindquistii]